VNLGASSYLEEYMPPSNYVIPICRCQLLQPYMNRGFVSFIPKNQKPKARGSTNGPLFLDRTLITLDVSVDPPYEQIRAKITDSSA